MNANDLYEIAVATIFIGRLLENALDIVNPQEQPLNILARQILEIRGVSANLFLPNQNTFSGGKNDNLYNESVLEKFENAYNNISDDQRKKIKIARTKIKEIFSNKTGGKRRKTKKSKNKGT